MSCKTVGPWRFVRFLLIKMSTSDFCTKWYANISIYIYLMFWTMRNICYIHIDIFIMRLINIQIYINLHFRSCSNTVIVFDYFPTDRGMLLSRRCFSKFQSLTFTNDSSEKRIHIDVGSMYGIFAYIWLKFMVNVGKHSIHGVSGL